MPLGVYCETLSFEVLDDPEIHELLGAHGVTLGHALRFVESDNFNPDRVAPHVELGLKLKAAGAGYALWPLLPKSLGYWVNERNIDSAQRMFDAVLEGCRRAGGYPDLFVMDIETPWQQMEKLFFPGPSTLSRIASGLGTIISNRKPARFSEAARRIDTIVRRVRADAAPVAAAVFPFLVADLAAGGNALQDYLEMPVFPVDFDAFNIMFYNSYIPAAAPFIVGPKGAARALFEYATVLVERFGKKAWVTLGSTWEGVLPGNEGKVFSSPEELVPDIAAAKAAGVSSIWLYCLEGVLYADQKLTRRRRLKEAEAFFETIAQTKGEEPPRNGKWSRSRSLMEFLLKDRLKSFYKWDETR